MQYSLFLCSALSILQSALVLLAPLVDFSGFQSRCYGVIQK